MYEDVGEVIDGLLKMAELQLDVGDSESEPVKIAQPQRAQLNPFAEPATVEFPLVASW